MIIEIVKSAKDSATVRMEEKNEVRLYSCLISFFIFFCVRINFEATKFVRGKKPMVNKIVTLCVKF